MPLYEYECIACHKRTEKIQKFSDPEITVCPYCAGKLERVLSAPAISFKGGGWFADGYGNAKPKSSGDSTSSNNDSSSASKSSESKSADSTTTSTPAAPTAAPAASAPSKSSSDTK